MQLCPPLTQPSPLPGFFLPNPLPSRIPDLWSANSLILPMSCFECFLYCLFLNDIFKFPKNPAASTRLSVEVAFSLRHQLPQSWKVGRGVLLAPHCCSNTMAPPSNFKNSTTLKLRTQAAPPSRPLPYSLMTSVPGLLFPTCSCHHAWWYSTFTQVTFSTPSLLSFWHLYFSLYFAAITFKISNSGISSSLYNVLNFHLLYSRSPVVTTLTLSRPPIYWLHHFSHLANDYISQAILQVDVAMWLDSPVGCEQIW